MGEIYGTAGVPRAATAHLSVRASAARERCEPTPAGGPASRARPGGAAVKAEWDRVHPRLGFVNDLGIFLIDHLLIIDFGSHT